MKRSVLLILLLGILQSFSFKSFQKNDLETSSLKSKVKSIKETKTSISNSTEDKNKQTVLISNLTYYDPEGKKIKVTEYKNGLLFSYMNYIYNQDSVITNVNEYNADNTLYLTITYSTNEKGTVTKADYNRLLQKTFDDNRRSIDVEYEKYYQNLFTYVKYKSDFKGNILEESYYTGNNRLSFKYINKYDFKYNKVEIKYYNKSGNLSWRKKLKYNAKGDVTESKFYESNRLALVSKYEYEYDHNSNWTKCTETRKLYDNFFANDLSDNTIITTRTIEYY